MSFLVVEFLEESEVDVISSRWMRGKDQCHWPPIRSSTKIAKVVQEHSSPEKTWPLFPVRILYTADNYQKARQKLSSAEVTSDIQSGAETTPKRKRIVNQRYLDDSSDEEELPRQRKSPRKHVSKSSDLPGPPSPPPFRSGSSSRLELPVGLSSFISSPPVTSRTPPVTSPTPSLVSSSPHGTRIPVSPAKRQVFVLLETMKARQDDILQKLQIIMQALSDRGEMAVESITDQLGLPFETTESMEAADRRLKEDPPLARRLISYLSLIGGRTSEDFIRRLMAALLTNTLAQAYNWCGRYQKLPFRELHLNNVIFKAVLKNPSSKKVSRSKVEEVQKAWLRFAKDRAGGRTERRAATMDDAERD